MALSTDVKPESLNGKWINKKDKYIYLRLQYYPHIERFYCILNDNPAMQTSITINSVKKLLKRYAREE